MVAMARPRFGWAGLLSGPAALALNTQLNYALTPWMCAHQVNLVPYITAVCATLALLGALASAHVWRRTGGEKQATTHFVAAISALIALLFTLVIVMQGVAGLFFTACER